MAKSAVERCSVENCYYWEANNCTAPGIEIATVQTNPRKAGRGDMEVGSLSQQDKADSSAETMCVTFRPRD